MKTTAQDIAREQAAQQDDFEIMLRRQGWQLIRHKPVHTDPKVIRIYQQDLSNGAQSHEATFYEAFGDSTFRKLLRHIFFHKRCGHEELSRICGSETKLNKYLSFMTKHGLILQEDDGWLKSPRYKDIDNIGPTLEWYVAEWFRTWLQVPARHSVAIKDVADGGDLDVVAFVDSIRVMVECKSGSPNQISETDIKLFLRRAADFNPEIAVLLIDTESRIDQQIEMLNRFRSGSDPLTPQDNRHSLYWGARHIYAINTRMSIADSLSAVLRLYYSKIRHLAFWRIS
ncbi:hypothetical protein EPA93_42340 [Ktedonosporobacter rubrisoli]|uniref:Uncharacterized protein n=1 Tax=Ktedonosporobacter rubrisoli TaxID=2509675 RepID=A0A4P6K251_KTERU|nr:hypothetical protein [Ktedonosporobacter rubrisoli]QBD82268.1 hypothetical protein EPA93_42340 [Ktedonosporobacter rubrisoli]